MASGNNSKIASFGDAEKLSQESGASIGKGINQGAGGDNAFSAKKDESPEPRRIPAHQRSAHYQKLIRCGLDKKVAAKLDDIYSTGKLAHSDLDDRALDALKQFPVDGALTVLKQFLDSNLKHVSNKSAYLCGVMKTYRQKSRSRQTTVPQVQNSPAKGPDEAKIKVILERTGYSLNVTTGQRKYGGPPPKWNAMPPGNGCEVFCGKIPKDMYEDELIPLFEKCGSIWEIRLLTDKITGWSRGYAYVKFYYANEAAKAIKELNCQPFRSGYPPSTVSPSLVDPIDISEEVFMKRFAEVNKDMRFYFLKQLVDLLPTDEMKEITALTHNSFKKRCRQEKKTTNDIKRAKLEKESLLLAPVSDSVITESAPVSSKSVSFETYSEGWYSKYRSIDILFIDVEKVEVPALPGQKNAKGKPKKFDMKAAEVAVCDLNGKPVYESLIYRENWRVNPHANNNLVSVNCLKSGRSADLVLSELEEIFENKLIVGVDVVEDLKSLDIVPGVYVHNLFDLQSYYYDETFSTKGKPIRNGWSLQKMNKILLNQEIQNDRHTAMDDAQSTASVFREHYLKINPAPDTKFIQFCM